MLDLVVFYVKGKGYSICNKVVEDPWKELPYSWLRVGGGSIYFEILVVLLICITLRGVHWSSQPSIYFHPKGYKFKAVLVIRAIEGLWINCLLLSKESQFSGGCLE